MKNQAGFVPVIIVLVVLIGFVGVYYLGRLNPKKDVLDPSSSPIATVVSSSKPTVPTTQPTLKPVSNIEQAKDTALNYLVLKGNEKENIIIDEPILLCNHKDKYSVSYKFKDDNTARGGTWLVVGKIDGNWIVPTDGDSNYCNWIKTAGLDESTQAFMGSSCKF